MKLTNREKILLPFLLIFILSALFINFIYLPISKDIKGLTAQTLDMNLKITEVQTKEAELEKLKQQSADLSAQIEKDNKDMLKIWDQAELLAFFDKVMAYQTEQKSIDFFDTVSVNQLQAGEVDITFNTNYTNLKSILNKLSDSDYFTTIPSYSVSKILTGAGDATDLKYDLEVGLKLEFYALSLQQEFPEQYKFMTDGFGKTNLFQ